MFLNLKALISNRESKSMDGISNSRFLAISFSSIVFMMTSISGYTQGENWRKITEMPNPRYGTGSCVLDGKIYVTGGMYSTESSPGTAAFHPVAMVNSFDPETGVWDTLAPLQDTRCYHQAVAVNGKIYVLGGVRSLYEESTATVEVYDKENNTWESTTDMPENKFLFGACILEDQIYVMGGVKSYATLYDPLKSVHKFNPASKTWETCKDMPTARSILTSDTVNGKIYAIGGGIHKIFKEGIVEAYDPAGDTWVRKANMSDARTYPCSAIVNDRIFVTGGMDRTSPPYQTKTEIYNPYTDSWIIAPREDFLPVNISDLSCVTMNKKLYVFGGCLESPIHWAVPDFFEFDFPVVRSRSEMQLSQNDSLLVEFYEDGSLYIVPEGTPADKDSIIKYQIGTDDGVANEILSIQLDTVPFGSYEIFGIGIDGRLDRGSSRFKVSMMDLEAPIIAAPDTVFQPDLILVESSEMGVIYLVPDSTEKDISVIREVCIDSVEIVAKTVSVPSNALANNTYWLYARDTAFNISEPEQVTIIDMTGMNELTSRRIKIYPNPFNHSITIHNSQPGSYTFEIHNVNGQLIREIIITGSSKQVDLSALRAGIYFIRIRSSDYTTVQKVIRK